MEEKNIPMIIMGKQFGFASGWDGVGDYILGFYDPQFPKEITDNIPVMGEIDYIEFDIPTGNVKGTTTVNKYEPEEDVIENFQINFFDFLGLFGEKKND